MSSYVLTDIYSPHAPDFRGFTAGKTGKLVALLDPLGIPLVSPEEVAYTAGNRSAAFERHLAGEYAENTASSPKTIGLTSPITKLTV
jgi:hypothetical protein